MLQKPPTLSRRRLFLWLMPSSYGFEARADGSGFVAGAVFFSVRAGWWRLSRRPPMSREEPIDFVGFSTIFRSALQ
jgi:hypothetical protein